MHETVKEQNLWVVGKIKFEKKKRKPSNVLISEQLKFASNLSNNSFTSLCSDFNYFLKEFIRKIIYL